MPAHGWYPDPQRPGGERWWDGSAWTEHERNATPNAGGVRGIYQDMHRIEEDQRRKAVEDNIPVIPAGKAILAVCILGSLILAVQVVPQAAGSTTNLLWVILGSGIIGFFVWKRYGERLRKEAFPKLVDFEHVEVMERAGRQGHLAGAFFHEAAKEDGTGRWGAFVVRHEEAMFITGPEASLGGDSWRIPAAGTVAMIEKQGNDWKVTFLQGGRSRTVHLRRASNLGPALQMAGFSPPQEP